MESLPGEDVVYVTGTADLYGIFFCILPDLENPASLNHNLSVDDQPGMKYNTPMSKLVMNLVFLLFFLLCFTVPVYAEDEHPEGTPEVYSEYVLLVDKDNGQILWSRNSVEIGRAHV